MWYGKIDNFINEVSRIALIRNLTTENSWLINNGIYYAGRLGNFIAIQTKDWKLLHKR